MKGAEGTASWTRPEWATLLGIYLVADGSSVAASNALYIFGTWVKNQEFFDWGWRFSVYLTSYFAYGLFAAGAGLCVLKWPKRTRKCVMVLLLLSLVLSGLGHFSALGVSYGTRLLIVQWLIGMVPLIAIFWFLRTGRRRAFFAGEGGPIGCPACGYSLRGLLNVRCPECGTEYE